MTRWVVCLDCNSRQTPPLSGLCTRCNASRFRDATAADDPRNQAPLPLDVGEISTAEMPAPSPLVRMSRPGDTVISPPQPVAVPGGSLPPKMPGVGTRVGDTLIAAPDTAGGPTPKNQTMIAFPDSDAVPIARVKLATAEPANATIVRLPDEEAGEAAAGVQLPSLDLPPEYNALPPLELNLGEAAQAPSDDDEIPSPRASMRNRGGLQPPAGDQLALGLVSVAIGGLSLATLLLAPPLSGRAMLTAGPVLLMVVGLLLAIGVPSIGFGIVGLSAAAAIAGGILGNPLVAIVAAMAAVSAWRLVRAQDDDLKNMVISWSLMAPAVVVTGWVALATIFAGMPGAVALATMQRKVSLESATAVTRGTMSFTFPSPWQQRNNDELTWDKPATQSTATAFVVDQTGDTVASEPLIERAKASLAAAGWEDFVLVSNNEIHDGSDWGIIGSFRTRRGLGVGVGGLRATKIDTHICVLAMVVPERFASTANQEVTDTLTTLRCSPNAAVQPRSLPSFVTIRGADAVALGLAVQQKGGKTIVAATDAIAKNPTAAVGVRSFSRPNEPLERGEPFRRAGGIMLILTDTVEGVEAKDWSSVVPPADRSQAINVYGIAPDGRSPRMLSRVVSAKGLTISDTALPFQSGVATDSAQAILGLLSMQNGKGQIIAQDTLEPLLKPRIKEALWKWHSHHNGQCQFDAVVEMDDPFQELDLIRVLVKTGETTKELLRSPVSPENATKLSWKGVCIATGDSLVFEASSATLRISTPPSGIAALTSLPITLRGRAQSEESIIAPNSSALGYLFDDQLLPEEWGLSCDPEEKGACEKACLAGKADACVQTGFQHQNTGRDNIAVNDFERGCSAGNLEGCIQAGFASSGPREDLQTKLGPLCKAGLKRACNALDPATWKQRAKETANLCAQQPATCEGEIDVLLNGPRRGPDVVKARGHLAQRCTAGQITMCRLLGEDYMFTNEPAKARPMFEMGCDRRDPLSCGQLGRLYASGNSVSRSLDTATRLLTKSCDAHDQGACAVLLRR